MISFTRYTYKDFQSVSGKFETWVGYCEMGNKRLKMYRLMVFAFVLCQLTSIAQRRHTKGTVLLEGLYGFPDNQTSMVRTTISYSESPPGTKEGSFYSVYKTTISNLDITSSQPFGCRMEYIYSNKIGLGLLLNYASTSATFEEKVHEDDYFIPNYISTSGNILVNSTDKRYAGSSVTLTRFRAIPTLNIHFGHSKRFDPYFQLGLGYCYNALDISTTNPKSRIQNQFDQGNYFNPLPICLRAAFGMRYYPIENVGLNCEMGLGGGPLFQAGITFRILPKI